MIGLDTNILLRLWLNDDPAQTNALMRCRLNTAVHRSLCW